MEEPKTDAEIVDWCRQQLQETLDRADLDAPTVQEALDSTGYPSKSVEVRLAEVRLLGKFDLDFSAPRYAHRTRMQKLVMARHWVYRHKRDGMVFVVHYPNQAKLMTEGTATLLSFVVETDPKKRN